MRSTKAPQIHTRHRSLHSRNLNVLHGKLCRTKRPPTAANYCSRNMCTPLADERKSPCETASMHSPTKLWPGFFSALPFFQNIAPNTPQPALLSNLAPQKMCFPVLPQITGSTEKHPLLICSRYQHNKAQPRQSGALDTSTTENSPLRFLCLMPTNRLTINRRMRCLSSTTHKTLPA